MAQSGRPFASFARFSHQGIISKCTKLTINSAKTFVFLMVNKSCQDFGKAPALLWYELFSFKNSNKFFLCIIATSICNLLWNATYSSLL